MKNTNELRIGNIVKQGIVFGTNKKEIFVSVDGKRISNQMPIEIITPIDITIEILKTIGFKKRNTRDDEDDKDFFIEGSFVLELYKLYNNTQEIELHYLLPPLMETPHCEIRFKHHEKVIYNDDGSKLGIIKGEDVFIMPKTTINTIHQLQNIYYILMGEELQINLTDIRTCINKNI